MSKSVNPINIACVLEAAVSCKRPVGHNEAAFCILYPKVIRNPVDQGLQRDAFVDDLTRCSKFGDVLVRRYPPAIGHGLVANLYGPAVGEFERPGSRLFCLN